MRNMKEEEIYNLAYKHRMSSKADVATFARYLLQEEGYDPDIVNLKTDGVSIESFKKLVRALYLAGYKDGFNQNSHLYKEKKRLEKEGKVLTNHARSAKYFNNNEIYKK